MIRGEVEVGNCDRLALGRGLAEQAGLFVDRKMPSLDRFVDAVGFDQIELMLGGVVAIDQHRIGASDFQRPGRDRRQHGVEIKRGGDRTSDLFEHLQLVDRLCEVAGALFHLGFEDGIGLLELARHAVELVGELFQLVLGVDVDAVTEIAGAEPPRAGAQRRDRNQHPARQQRTGKDRNRKPKSDQERDPHQLVADRRQGLRRRLLEQHGPAELRHRARRGQNRMAVGVGAGRQCLPVRRHQRCYLRQGREIPRDLRPLGRRCQHLAALVDHIGEGALADLRVTQEVGEETKIDFGDGDGGRRIGARMRNRDRHEGAAPLEKRRGIADALGKSLGQTEIARKVGLAADHDLGVRQPQLLAAVLVE